MLTSEEALIEPRISNWPSPMRWSSTRCSGTPISLRCRRTPWASRHWTSADATSVLNTIGLLFKLYGDHFVGPFRSRSSGNSPQPAPKYPVGGDQPKTNSGSPTYPLDMVAAFTRGPEVPDRRRRECDGIGTEVRSEVIGRASQGPSTLWRMTGKTLEAANRAGKKPQVEVKEIRSATCRRQSRWRRSALTFISFRWRKRHSEDVIRAAQSLHNAKNLWRTR